MMRRTMLVLAAVAVSACSAKIDQAKFDALNRSARTVRESTSIGVNVIKFRELVSAYAIEASLAKDRAKAAAETRFVGLHEVALASYRDSLEVWKQKLAQRESGIDTGSNAELRRIVDDYAISASTTGFNQRFDADAAIQKIWSRAHAKLDAADALYRGEDVPSLPKP